MSSKGLTPVVAVTLLILVVVGMVGIVYTTVNNLILEQDADMQPRGIQPEDITIESIDNSGNAYRVFLRNTASRSGDVRIYGRGNLLNNTTIPSYATGALDLGCLSSSSSDITISTKLGEERRSIEEEIPPRYCIIVEDTRTERRGFQTYKIWNIKVVENNAARTPYSNKEIRAKFEEEEKLLTTDSQGRATVETEWDIEYVPPRAFWKTELPYKRDVKSIETSAVDGKYQPPNHVRLKYDSSASKPDPINMTQQVVLEEKSDAVNISYDVIPHKVTDNNITFNVTMDVLAKDGLKDDWDNHNSDSRLLYNIPFAEGAGGWEGPFAEVEKLECETSSPDVTCGTNSLSLTLKNDDFRNRQFQESTLPEDSGEKYIPVKYDVSASGGPFIGGLNPKYYMHYGNSSTHHNGPSYVNEHKFYFFSNKKRMIYVPGGTEKSFYDNLSVDDLRYDIQEDMFDDDDGEINTTFRANTNLVTSAAKWTIPPEIIDKQETFFSLNTTPEKSGSEPNLNGGSKNVVYEWNDVTEDEEYTLNFTATFKREDSEWRYFFLPPNQGTFGFFPENGGRTREVYTKGGVRYPESSKAGTGSIKLPIPEKTTGAQAFSYKINRPLPNNEWAAKTYVVNTGDIKIDEIYLLNSQGSWEIFEETSDGDNALSPGEEFIDGFNFESNVNKIVELNIAYQGTNYGISKPSYNSWPFKFHVNLTGDNDYDINYNHTVDCDFRNCVQWFSSNQNEAVPLDNTVWNAPDASKRRFPDTLVRLDFTMKNGENNPSTGTLYLSDFRFWVWYFQPFSYDLDSRLDNRPDNMTIRTLDDGPNIGEGYYVERFK